MPDTRAPVLTVLLVPELFNARRFALVILIVLLLGLCVAPLLLLAPRASQLASNTAYQDLAALVESHNGQVSYNALAAMALEVATATPSSDGSTTYSLRDSSGVCWSVVIPSGHATALPAQAPTSYCR